MSVLVTGAAGFLGMHVALRLLARGERVVGVDDLDEYYSLELKEARLAELEEHAGFSFHYLDIGDAESVAKVLAMYPDISGVVHLAAQVGVGHSHERPRDFLHTNVSGMFILLEACRALAHLRHIVYGSSSAVYGGNRKVPFAESDRADNPRSIYAASKRADELLAAAYAHRTRMPMTGLRLFAIYGPWGRPDMFYMTFTEAILARRPIRVYNRGDFRRDVTYVDDAVTGILAALDRPPAATGPVETPHRILNIGNDHAVSLGDFIREIERATGERAIIEDEPMKADDLLETYADIALARRALGYEPKTQLSEGAQRFVEWYLRHYERKKVA
ncbi:MAG TPA: NAD-dependent epimerase/dehydratase family protein [Dongiaceae bacterium]|jgi:UDP-glucuronate 4-epimerase|nr:NAD-dependent epimerase/dehydratase family protein [Dongiaceae bacterium]